MSSSALNRLETTAGGRPIRVVDGAHTGRRKQNEHFLLQHYARTRGRVALSPAVNNVDERPFVDRGPNQEAGGRQFTASVLQSGKGKRRTTSDLKTLTKSSRGWVSGKRRVERRRHETGRRHFGAAEQRTVATQLYGRIQQHDLMMSPGPVCHSICIM